MRHLIQDYPLPSYKDEKVSETEYRAAIGVISDAIETLRATRHNYEQVLAKRFVDALDEGYRQDDANYHKPYVPDIRDVYLRRENKRKKLRNY